MGLIQYPPHVRIKGDKVYTTISTVPAHHMFNKCYLRFVSEKGGITWLVPPSSEQEPHGLGTQIGGERAHVLVMLRSQGPEVYDEAGSGRLRGML